MRCKTWLAQVNAPRGPDRAEKQTREECPNLQRQVSSEGIVRIVSTISHLEVPRTLHLNLKVFLTLKVRYCLHFWRQVESLAIFVQRYELLGGLCESSDAVG